MHSLAIRTLLICFTLFIQCTYSSPSNDFDRNFTVATLSEITLLYTDHPLSDNDSISVEALTKFSQNVLNEFSNVTESAIDSMEFMEDQDQRQHVEDEDDIKYESAFDDDIIIDTISNTIEEDNPSPNIDSTSSNNNKDITNPIYSVQYLNDNATVWELLYAQVKADITPFLILIPQPMKVYIVQTYHKSIKSVKQIAKGAFSPWSSVVWKSTNQVGNFLIVLGKKLVDIAERNSKQSQEQQQHQRNDSIDSDNVGGLIGETERITDVNSMLYQ